MKVLVIEDNPQNLKLFRILIEYQGYQCLTAQDGETGIAMALQEAPDLILMDIQMPKIDGIAALRLLREDDALKGIPVIAVTSYAMHGDRERFLAEGFDDYIEKPVSNEHLIAVVQKYDSLRRE